MSRAVQRRRGEALAVDGLTHGVGDEDVLEEVSVTVSAGETLAVIGPSGTGKTTLLRLLALFEEPDAGTITVDGADVWATSADARLDARRRVGMVFQTPHLFDASVQRNAAYGRHIRRGWRDRITAWLARVVNGGDATDAVLAALETVGMRDAAGQDATAISGGEAQRVAFARALAYDPDVLLLDEPTSDLDPRNTAVIEEAIADARDEGIGIVVATHDMHQAERVADRVAVMIGGRLIAVGPPEDVFDDPDDERVRGFIEGELVY